MTDAHRELLDLLDDGSRSSGELASQLGTSDAELQTAIEELREAGVQILHDGKGYRIGSVPDYGLGVAYGLEAPFTIEYHETITSTNDRGRELAREGADDVVVVADIQTGGRGRRGREWRSPTGGIWLSIVCRPDIEPGRVSLYTLAAAVATTRAAREAGVEAVIKWPNDVLVIDTEPSSDRGERKLAGILTEVESDTDGVSWVVVGIGVNANIDPEALPDGSTSLRERVGDVSRRVFVQRLLEEFDTLRTTPETVPDAWREYAITLGRRVRVDTATGTLVGDAIDIDASGSLLIDTDEGRVRVDAGDCEHLRRV